MALNAVNGETNKGEHTRSHSFFVLLSFFFNVALIAWITKRRYWSPFALTTESAGKKVVIQIRACTFHLNLQTFNVHVGKLSDGERGSALTAILVKAGAEKNKDKSFFCHPLCLFTKENCQVLIGAPPLKICHCYLQLRRSLVVFVTATPRSVWGPACVPSEEASLVFSHSESTWIGIYYEGLLLLLQLRKEIPSVIFHFSLHL